MSATYNIVTIGARDYDVYADIATADDYLAADATTAGAAWRAADDETKARALVTATRLLDRVTWPGSKTDEDQALAWPRTGTGVDGVEDEVIPQQIIDATSELAASIVGGYDASNTPSTGQTVKRQKAGSVEIEYFTPAQGDGNRFPLPVWELIAALLGGSSDCEFAGSWASGTCGDSLFYDTYERNTGL